YFKEGSLSTNQLVGKDWLSETDQRRIERAYDFLLRLRTDLHYATGRATDILHLNLQEQIAKRLNYSIGNGQLRSETLMRDYFEHTRNIFRVTERISAQFGTGHVTRGAHAKSSRQFCRGRAKWAASFEQCIASISWDDTSRNSAS